MQAYLSTYGPTECINDKNIECVRNVSKIVTLLLEGSIAQLVRAQVS